MEDYKTVKRFESSPEANMAKDFLTNHGILAVITDEHAGQIFSSVVKGIKLIVPPDQYAKAKKLLDDEGFGDNVYTESVIEILEESGALLAGHFKLTSGLHSNRYIEKIKVIQYPDKVETLCSMLLEKLEDIDPDVVIGLAMGGIALGYEVARQMGKRFVFTQRKDGRMTIRSGFDVKPGMKALIIEDIVTTGGSVKEVIELLDSMNIEVQAVGLLVDRTGGNTDFGVRTESLLQVKIETFQPDKCPLCKKGVSLTIPGSSDK